MHNTGGSPFLSHSLFSQHEGSHVLCMYMKGFLCICTYPLNIQAKEKKTYYKKKKESKVS